MIEKKEVDENTEENPVEESTEEETPKEEEVEGSDAPADLNINVGDDVESDEAIS